MYVQKTLLSVVAVVFFHCQHNSKQQQHKSHTHLKQAIRIMHACMCINQYMLDISGVLQCIANAFHMHMHMFLKNLETQNHTISRLPKSKILCKNRDMSPKFIGIIGGELFVETAVYKPKRTAHRRWGNFCAKSVLFLKYQISFVVAYMLMTSGVCVWPSLHLILYMCSCVFVIIGVCVGKLVL